MANPTVINLNLVMSAAPDYEATPIIQNNIDGTQLVITLFNVDGSPYTPSGTVYFKAVKSDWGTIVQDSATGLSVVGNVVTITLHEQVHAKTGLVAYQILVTGGVAVYSQVRHLRVYPGAEEGAIISGNEFTSLANLLVSLEDAETIALAAKELAESTIEEEALRQSNENERIEAENNRQSTYNDIVKARDVMLSLTTLGKNLFNPLDENILIGGYINPNTGTTITNATYSESGFIRIDEGEYVSVTNAQPWFAWYDVNKVFISGKTNTPPNMTAQAPTNTYYVRVAYLTATDPNTIQVEIGNEPTSFEPYGYQLHIADKSINFQNLSDNVVNQILKGGMVFTKVGNEIQIRAPWSTEYDIVHKMELEYGNNKILNFKSIELIPNTTPKDSIITGAVFKSCTDDITPIYFNGSYIGGNHGYNFAFQINKTSHGKTTADIGSVWYNAATTKNYVITSIVNSNSFIVISEFTGNESIPFVNTPPIDSLTHVSGATHTDTVTGYATPTITQLWPSVNQEVVKAYINGNEEVDITKNSYSVADYIDICHSYNIIYTPSAIAYLKTNVGSNTNNSIADESITDKYCRVSIVYRFTKNGACTVHTSYDFDRAVTFGFSGMVQASTIGAVAYVPNTNTYKTLTTQASSTFKFEKVDWTNADKPPYRYYQFINTSATQGLTLGYCPDYAYGKPATRILHLDTAGNIAGSSKKLYPYIIDADYTSETNLYLEGVAYRIPLQQYDVDFTSVCWYWVGDDIYLMIDAHKNVNKYIKLPNYMIGMKVNQLDVHTNTVIGNEVIGADGLKIRITNNYGYAVLKLTK